MSAITSMLLPAAESPIDLASLFRQAEAVADWIDRAEGEPVVQRRRLAVVLSARATTEPRNLLSVSREMADWLNRY
jgi:hypothetical protein